MTAPPPPDPRLAARIAELRPAPAPPTESAPAGGGAPVDGLSDRQRDALATLAAPIPAEWIDPMSPPPRREQLLTTIEGFDFLPAGVVGLLISAGGCGKTQVLVHLAASVAAGRPWLEVFKPVRPGRVALLLGEEDAPEVWRRLARAVGCMGLLEAEREAVRRNIFAAGLASVDVALLFSPNRFEQPAPSPWSVALTETLERNGPWDLVCFDPVSRWSGVMQENDNATGTRFVQTLERLAALPGRPAVLSAMHTSKAERGPGNLPAMPRGASAYYDGARWVVALGEDKDGGVILSHTKSNYSARHEAIRLLRGEGGSLVYAGPADQPRNPAAATAGKVAAFLDGKSWLSGKVIREGIGSPHWGKAKKALDFLLEEGRIESMAGPRSGTLYRLRPDTDPEDTEMRSGDAY